MCRQEFWSDRHVRQSYRSKQPRPPNCVPLWFELKVAKSETKNSDVQDMKTVVENRLRKMLAENPTRANYQERFDEIVRDDNKEKDKNTMEATFEALSVHAENHLRTFS